MAWAPTYVDTDELLKGFLKILGGDSVDDTFLDLDGESASRAIDRACNRQFGKVDAPEQRFYQLRWDRDLCRWYAHIDDLMDLTGFQVELQEEDGTAVGAVDSYVLEPRNAAQKGRPRTKLVILPGSASKPRCATDVLAPTGRWGWNAIPNGIKMPCLLQASRFHARRESPFGVAGSPEQGNEVRLLAKLDPDVDVMVASFRRRWAAR